MMAAPAPVAALDTESPYPTLVAYRDGKLAACWHGLTDALVAGDEVPDTEYFAAVLLGWSAAREQEELECNARSEPDVVLLRNWLKEHLHINDALAEIADRFVDDIDRGVQDLQLSERLMYMFDTWEPQEREEQEGVAARGDAHALLPVAPPIVVRPIPQLPQLLLPAHPAPDPGLGAIFGTLVRHHVATPVQPLPERAAGISWIWSADGLYKRGVSEDLDALIVVDSHPSPAAGLARLLPHVRWSAWPQRIPFRLLTALLDDARRAMSEGAIARPIEKQYFLVWRDDDLRLIAPRGQEATPGRVRYPMPERGAVLVDVHSHHEMPAFFSHTDDADDLGLSVSAVIGKIFTAPEIAVRVNVFGHRMRVPATLIFDNLGPFRDVYGGTNATTED